MQSIKLGKDLIIPSHVAFSDNTVIPKKLTMTEETFKKHNTNVVQNIPMYGFKILCEIDTKFDGTSSMSSYDNAIYVQDPRGPIITITAQQMMLMLHENMIHNMEILKPCIYSAKTNSSRAAMLIPAESSGATAAADNKTRYDKRLTPSSIPVDSKIELLNGEKYYYHGAYKLYSGTKGDASRKVYLLTNPKTNRILHKSKLEIASFDASDTLTSTDAYLDSYYTMYIRQSIQKNNISEYKYTVLLNKRPAGSASYNNDIRIFELDSSTYRVELTSDSRTRSGYYSYACSYYYVDIEKSKIDTLLNVNSSSMLSAANVIGNTICNIKALAPKTSSTTTYTKTLTGTLPYYDLAVAVTLKLK